PAPAPVPQPGAGSPGPRPEVRHRRKRVGTTQLRHQQRDTERSRAAHGHRPSRASHTIRRSLGQAGQRQMTTPREYIARHREEFLADLDQWLRIPSISAQPGHHADVLHSAEWFTDAAQRAGFPTAEIWPTAGLPACYAEWCSDDADAPTVLVYGHHD